MTQDTTTFIGLHLWIVGESTERLDESPALVDAFDAGYIRSVALDENSRDAMFIEMLAGLTGVPVLWLKRVNLPRSYAGQPYEVNLVRALRPDVALLLEGTSLTPGSLQELAAQKAQVILTPEELYDYGKRTKRTP